MEIPQQVERHVSGPNDPPPGNKPEAVVVVLMGMVGSGKSTFISRLTTQAVEIHHDLGSNATTAPEKYDFQYGDRRVILVDTPGFNNPNQADVQVLRDIALFLSTLHMIRDEGARFAGIVYLHRITDSRMSGSNLKNLHMLQKMCGPENFGSIALVTNMWEDMMGNPDSLQRAEQREAELRKEFWSSMVNKGSTMLRHDGTTSSALNIVRALIDKDTDVSLHIQRELAVENKTLGETMAGQFVREELFESRKRFERELVEIGESIQEATRDNDQDTVRVLEAEGEVVKANAAKTAEDADKLAVNIHELLAEDSSPMIQQVMRQYGVTVVNNTGEPPLPQTALLGNTSEIFETLNSDMQTVNKPGQHAGQVAKSSKWWRQICSTDHFLRKLFQIFLAKSGSSGKKVETERDARKNGYRDRAGSMGVSGGENRLTAMVTPPTAGKDVQSLDTST